MSGKKQLGESGYRHELKYYITEGDHALLSRKLSLTMEQDAFAKKSGGEYFTRSLYFDDRDDSAFRESWTARTSVISSAYAYTTCGTT